MFKLNKNIELPKAILPSTSKAKIGMQKSNKIFANYAPGAKPQITPRARNFANTGKLNKNDTAKKEETPVLKEEINLRVNAKSGHYNPSEVKKTEKNKSIS